MVGFSETIFELLEVKSKSMTDSERCCVIVFDEMSYDRARDTVFMICSLLYVITLQHVNIRNDICCACIDILNID